MIYLYDGTETDFRYNGKPLPKAYDVVVDYLINDEFYITGKHLLDKDEVYKDVKEDKILKVHTPKGMQPFRIIDSKDRSGFVEFEAWPLFIADMRNKAVKPLRLKNQDLMTALHVFKNSLLVDVPFNFSANITDLRDYHTQDVNEQESNPNQLYDALEVFKDIVNRWNAEVVMEGHEVRLLERTGTNTQALLYEKKNISDFVDEHNITGVVTRVHGKSEWQDEAAEGESEGKKHFIEATVDSPLINQYSGIVFEKQYTNNNIRTKSEMENWLKLKFTTENIDKPKRTIETETNIVDGTYLEPGDTLILKYIKHDVDMSIRMVGYKYDGFHNRYISTILGDARARVASSINQEVSGNYIELERKTLSWLDGIRQAITATYFNEDGYNYDLQADNKYGLPGGYYSFDAPIDQNPDKVIYIGAGKLLIANSKTPDGRWEWRTAATGDGLVADVINTGQLNSELVQIGWNNINNWVRIHEDGITMLGSGSWRRNVLSASGIELYSDYGANHMAGLIGYFSSTSEPNWRRPTPAFESDAMRHFVGLAAAEWHKVGIGYSDDPNDSEVFKLAIEIDPRSLPHVRIHEDIDMMGNNLRSVGNHIGFTAGIIEGDSNTRNVYVRSENGLFLRSHGNTTRLSIGNSVNAFTDINMQGHEVINQSDMRLKKDFEELDFSGIEQTKRLRKMKSYVWDHEHPLNKHKPKERTWGLLAQENPFLTTLGSGDDHYEKISMNKQLNLATLTTQELIEKTEKLEDENQALKEELKEIREALVSKGIIEKKEGE